MGMNAFKRGVEELASYSPLRAVTIPKTSFRSAVVVVCHVIWYSKWDVAGFGGLEIHSRSSIFNVFMEFKANNSFPLASPLIQGLP